MKHRTATRRRKASTGQGHACGGPAGLLLVFLSNRPLSFARSRRCLMAAANAFSARLASASRTDRGGVRTDLRLAVRSALRGYTSPVAPSLRRASTGRAIRLGRARSRGKLGVRRDPSAGPASPRRGEPRSSRRRRRDPEFRKPLLLNNKPYHRVSDLPRGF